MITIHALLEQNRSGRFDDHSADMFESIAAEGALACQVCMLGNVRVDVPPDSITAAQRAQIEGRARQSSSIQPKVTL